MNSYPLEFLSSPQPLMFVAGLDAPRRASSVVGPPPGTGSGPSSNTGSVPTSPPVDDRSLPLMSPEAGIVPLPDLASPGARQDTRDADFDKLKADLRTALAPYGGPTRVWVPEAERLDFRVMLVDKGVRLPLRKMAPPPGEPNAATFSPLSPKTSSSPLHPDGLIAPVWVRKHAELVPSVFVLFLRLYETPPRPKSDSPLGQDVLEEAEKAREREADEQLVKEIAERRKRLGERGIKLTVVLMASPATLDSRERLSHLRRASSLSAKAGLFVLTPVPASELPDFVRTLQESLLDAALEYYAGHSKRVRRKRGRVGGLASQPPSALSSPAKSRSRAGSSVANSRPLSAQGWTVRYDWKLGWFAEVRGEVDQARRHYEDCWNELARMFSTPGLLQPRTKRWAEAKVLADCVAVRICKLLLYEDAGSRVLIPFFVHLRRFGELSRGWGMGEDAFEFWSWVARQYRIFGEVLEIAQRHGYVIPAIDLPMYPTPLSAGGLPHQQQDLTMPESTMNPLHVLHPPAFYFYTAAMCTIERKARFDEAVAAEEDGSSAAGASAPGFANEKNVDHAALVIELLTKAFNLLKESNEDQSRLALYIAFRTAKTYARTGQYDLAMRFLDHIANKFAEDRWVPIMREIRKIKYECAQATGNVDVAARLLLERMAPGSDVEGEERAALQDDFMSLLSTTAPSSSEPILLEIGEDDALFEVCAGFREAEPAVGSGVAVQVSITSPPGVDVSRITFSQLRIGVGDAHPDIVVSAGGDSRTVDVGTIKPNGTTINAQAPLQWAPGQVLAINAQVLSDAAAEAEVTDVVLILKQGAWTFELNLPVTPMLAWTSSTGNRYIPIRGLWRTATFMPRAPELTLDIDNAPVAFAGESLSVTVKVTSNDDRKFSLRLSVLLQPGPEPDGATITLGKEQSETMVKDFALGVIEANGAVEHSLTLIAPDDGTKMLDFSVVADPDTSAAVSDGDEDELYELTKTAVVPILPPFAVAATSNVVRSSGGSDAGGRATVAATITVPSPRAVVVHKLGLSAMENAGVSLVNSSLDTAALPQTWDQQTGFSFCARFALRPVTVPSKISAVVEFTWSPADAPAGTAPLVARVPLPVLALPPPDAFVTAAVSSPATVRAHQPFGITLSLSNAHPSEPAWLGVHGDTADGFVWAGPRDARVGPIAPGGTAQVQVEAVAVGQAGWQALPHMSVWHGDGNERRDVRLLPPTDRPAGGVLVQP